MKKINALGLASIVALSGLGIAFAQPGASQPKHDEKPAAQPATDVKSQAEKPAEQPADAASPIFDIADHKVDIKPVATSEIKLLIEDLKVGDGKECPIGATVTINYHGALKNGIEFDSTRKKDAVTYGLRQLIQGWQMGIPGMKVGGIRRLTIPYQLAYGEREIPGPDGKALIPPKSDLVFLIELKDVK
jgi:FKBP-type peptidyl-prolyl cis-trans isomerase